MSYPTRRSRAMRTRHESAGASRFRATSATCSGKSPIPLAAERGDYQNGGATGLLDAFDAFDAFESHLDALVVIGAQAIYLHTGSLEVALAEFTTDGDVAVDPDHLGSDPLVEATLVDNSKMLIGSLEPSADPREFEVSVAGPAAPGSAMAGAAEELVGDPAGVAESVALLAQDLLDILGR